MHDLEILYRDQWLIAIHKPAGLLVHKSELAKDEDDNAMHRLRDQIGQWVYPVHRLDRPTSGVLLFALDADTARKMGELFELYQIQKTYWAIVRGFLNPQQGVIDHPVKAIAGFKSDKAKYAAKERKAAITQYRSLGQLELPHAVDRFPTSRYSLLELQPKTGRKHQLRQHLKHLSHPIIGDPKYGKSVHNRFFAKHFGCSRLLLAATRLEFLHPVSEEKICIEVSVDGVFKTLTEEFLESRL